MEPKKTQVNIVEFVSDDEQAFDQPCIYGNRVGFHSVYCHHPDGIARKCYYRWETDPKVYEKNECGGYKPNPNWKPKPTAAAFERLPP